MQQVKFVEERRIALPNNDSVLEVQMTQELIDRIRYQFSLASDDVVSDDHVRMFVWGTVNGAIDKIEQEMNDGTFAGI